MTLDKNVCENFVENTFEYFYYFNNFVWKYLNSVNFMAMCNIGGHQEFKLSKHKDFIFLQINNTWYLEQCKKAFDKNLNEDGEIF